MRREILSCAALAAVLILAAPPPPAQAQRNASKKERGRAERLYREGLRLYNVGEYDRAIKKFKASYLVVSSPVLLFNIGQAQRLKGDCDQALRSYRAYLREVKDSDEDKQVRDAIALCEKKLADESDDDSPASARPPRRVASAPPDTGDGGVEGETPTEPNQAVAEEAPPVAKRPRLVVARIGVGPAYASMGGVEPGALISVAGMVAYPLRVGAATIEPGLTVTYTPVPWDGAGPEGPVSGTLGMSGVLGNVSVTYPLARRLSLRLDAGAGLLVLSGLVVEGNPFLNPDDVAGGAVALPHARAAAGLEIDISELVALNALPVFSYSPGGDLRDDIRSLVRLDVLFGAAFKL